MHGALDRLDRVLHVIDRRRHASGVDNEIEVLAQGQWVRHVGPDGEDVRVADTSFLMRLLVAGNKVVDGNKGTGRGEDFGVEALHERRNVPPKKTRSSREKHRLPRESLHITAEHFNDFRRVVALLLSLGSFTLQRDASNHLLY